MMLKNEESQFKDDLDADDVIGAEGWLFSYADMMTLLFGFFVMLFAFSMENQGQIEQKLKDIGPMAFGPRGALDKSAPIKNPMFLEMERRLQQLSDKNLSLQSDIERILLEKKTVEDNVQSLSLALNEFHFGKNQSPVKEAEMPSPETAINESKEKLAQVNQKLALVVAEKLRVTVEKQNAENQVGALKKSLDELLKEKNAALNENQRKALEIATLVQSLQKLETEKNLLSAESKQKDEAVAKFKGDFLTMQSDRERSRSEKKILDERFEKVREENEKMAHQVQRLEGIRKELEQAVVLHDLQKKKPEHIQKSPASVPSSR